MPPAEDGALDAVARVAECLEKGGEFRLATVVRSEDPELPAGLKALSFPGGRVEGPRKLAEALTEGAPGGLERKDSGVVKPREGLEVFVEVFPAAARVLVCGAGHIAVPLARYARDAGFEVSVLDDREEYASAGRFPGCAVTAGDFITELRRTGFGPFPYVVVITRGHAHDLDCLGEILRWDTRYVGLIGSRRRVKFVKEELARRGLGERAADLFSPIGLGIGADTPEEIALSIAAELVCVRRKGDRAGRDFHVSGWGDR